MKAAVYYNNSDIRLQDVPTPKIGGGELLMKVHSSGICGSDVMEWYRIHKAPLILGHEVAGEVVEAGSGVTNFKVGDHLVATHHVPCFSCHYCLRGHETICDLLLSGTHFDPGGFCEYLRLPAVNVERGAWKLDFNVDYDCASFVEPLACVLRGQRTTGMRQGDSVLVLGSGISGLLHVNLAAATGAGLIAATDISDYRLRAAKRFGADLVIKADLDVASLFKEANRGLGADLVIVCTSAAQALKQAMESVERGGTILLFAPGPDGFNLPLPINDLFWRRDVTITTTYAGAPVDCADALELISRKRVMVEDMITHRFGLADTVKGFQLVASGDESIKVIIRPHE